MAGVSARCGGLVGDFQLRSGGSKGGSIWR